MRKQSKQIQHIAKKQRSSAAHCHCTGCTFLFFEFPHSWCKGCLAVQQVIHFLWQLTHGGPRKQVLQREHNCTRCAHGWCRHSEAFGEVGQKSRTQRAPNAWHGSTTVIIWLSFGSRFCLFCLFTSSCIEIKHHQLYMLNAAARLGLASVFQKCLLCTNDLN